MSGPLSAAERDGVIQSFLIGTGRRPFGVPAAFSGLRPDAAILASLATVAAERRFTRARPAGSAADANASPLPDDARPLMPAGARKALGSLVGLISRGDTQVQVLVGAALDTAEGFGWRVHPFDYPVLAKVLANRQSSLGSPERAYFRAIGKRLPAEERVLTPEDWDIAKPMERYETFLRMRREDPASARTFLEERIGAEKPDQREALLDCLSLRISEEDRPFLEQIAATDRSEHVRRKARHLMATMPAPTERDEVVRAVADAFEVGKSLIPWRGKSMHLRRSLSPHVLERARNAQVTVAEIAAALGLERGEFLGLFPDNDRDVVGYLLGIAAATEDIESFIQICERNQAIDWIKVLEFMPHGLFTLGERRRVVRSLRGLDERVRDRGDWIHLVGVNKGPLARRQADLIIGSKSVEGYVGGGGYRDREDWAHLAALAGLVPPASHPAFRAAIVRSFGEVPAPIVLFLDFVEAADRDARDSGIVPHYEE